MDKVRIGIIGTGFIGNVHGRIFAREEQAVISALYDIVPERSDKTARSIGGKVCTSQDELLDNCDAVLVCTPNRTHIDIASAAVAAGTIQWRRSTGRRCRTVDPSVPLSCCFMLLQRRRWCSL